MSKLGLSDEERRFAARVAMARTKRRSLIGFYAGPLVPLIGFGIYGLVASEDAAVGMAFIGLAFFSVWRVASEVVNVRVFESLLSKVDLYEREDDRPVGSVTNENIDR